MSAPEFLQWVNLAIIPGLFYIVKLERRLMRLEITLGLLAGRCTKDKQCTVKAIADAA